MKNLLIILTICTLSGCGLFRKSTKSSSSSGHDVKTEVNEESKGQVKVDLTGESKIVSNEQKQVQNDIDENTSITADEIEVKPDGSIAAKGNAKLNQNRKDRGKSNENKAVERSDNYVGHMDVKSKNKVQEKQGTRDRGKDMVSQSEPKGFIWIWAAVGLLIVTCGVIWFLRRK